MVSETKLNPEQYKKLSNIVYKASGVVLNEKKYNLLVARLAKRMRLTNMDSVSDYIRLISKSQDEFTEFIDATTTNHTFFFRENKHCEFLIKTMDRTKPLKIWSAASSSGEEAFSIAVQFLANSFSFNIHATDISGSMLKKGQRAIYSKEKMDKMPTYILHSYFQNGKGKWHDHVKVKPEVQKLVTFEKFNLLSDTPFDTYDIIFCRNVMIYFDTPTRQKVVTSLCKALKPGGYFFVGMSENLHGLEHNLSVVLPSGYKK
ncbi:MAG: chemotaxis protein CheR [Desulfobacterales bacterium]|nr:chemotaxis protein CheR [Desulfobacterales bacterium]MBU8909911.1 chemotaxis protein CheR [Desulfobacterales bacterium]